MIDLSCKLLIIGGGPGGYVCGIRAGQLGIETIVVEEAKAGGTCLNVGCIPSKALIHAAHEFHKLALFDGRSALGITAAGPAIDLARTIAWKDGIVARLTGGVEGLLKTAGTRLIHGTAEFLDGKTVQVTRDGEPIRIVAETVVIATGSEPVELPFLAFGGKVISSTEALALDSVPERLVVVGGGYIGLEIGTAFAKLGSAVTVVEAMARILPQYDSALTRPVMTSLETLGIKVLLDTRAKGLSDTGLSAETDGESIDLPADRILVTVGRRPRSQGAGIPGLSLDMVGQFIRIDETCRTSMRGVSGNRCLRPVARGGEIRRHRDHHRPIPLHRQWPRHEHGSRQRLRPCRRPQGQRPHPRLTRSRLGYLGAGGRLRHRHRNGRPAR